MIDFEEEQDVDVCILVSVKPLAICLKPEEEKCEIVTAIYLVHIYMRKMRGAALIQYLLPFV